MGLIITAIIAIPFAIAFAFYLRLSDIANKLTFMNAQVKELHKSMVTLQAQLTERPASPPQGAAQEHTKPSEETAAASGVRKEPKQVQKIEAKPTKSLIPNISVSKELEETDKKREAARHVALAKEQIKAFENNKPERLSKPAEAEKLAQESTEREAPNPEQNTRAERPQTAPRPPERAPIETWFTRIARSVVDNFRQNWVVWLGALSLAFGGIFFVQYGIENGVLSPAMRISCALAFGILLIAGSEFFRYRQKDKTVDPFGPLVAAASGGLASLFGAIIGAYSLYGLIGPTTTFIGLAIVSWLAIGGGLLYGPVLATIGILGAYYSPLLVGGADPSPLLYLYFAMVLAVSLTVERLQRWIWLSSLSVLSTFVWVILLQIQMPEQQLTPLMLTTILTLTVTVPAFGLPPQSPFTSWPLDREFWDYKTTYPALLSYVVVGLVLLIGLFFSNEDPDLALPMTLMFAGLLLAHVFFLSKAESLDLIGPALLAGFALMMWLPKMQSWETDPVIQSFYLPVLPLTIAAAIGGSLRRGQTSIRAWFWNRAAVALPGIGAVVYFVYVALHAPELQGKAGAFGYLFAVGLAICVALYFRNSAKKCELATEGSSALAFLLFLPFCYFFMGEIALPIVLMASAVLLLEIADLCSLKLARKAFYAYLSGVIYFTTKRYLDGFADAGYGDIGLLFLPILVLCAIGWWRGKQRSSESESVVFETTVWAALSLFFCALLQVFYRDQGSLPAYVMYGSYSLVFAVQLSVQQKRMSVSSSFAWLRAALFHTYWTLAALNCAIAIVTNPLGQDYVFGTFPIDSLSIGFLYPALALVLATERFWTNETSLQSVTRALAGILLVIYVGLEIRAFWQGPVLTSRNVMLEELYSYTVAMLVFSVGLIAFASVKQRKRVGQLGLAFIIVTCLKVFFIDMSGLYGLARATSFIGLGLTLVGIAWANKRFLSFPTPTDQVEEEPELKTQTSQT